MSKHKAYEAKKWYSVKDGLPTDDELLCVFVEFENRIIIQACAGAWIWIKRFKNYETKNDYTHWMPLPGEPKH